MSRYDAIIIGAGINGLVAGATLARCGKRVCIVEARSDLGGMATYSCEGGPALAQFLYNLSPKLRRALGFDAQRWPFETDEVTTLALSENDPVLIRGTRVTRPDGSAHRDADAYARLTRQLSAYGALLRQLAETAPPGQDVPLMSPASLKQLMRLGRFGLNLRRLGADQMRHFMQVILSNAYDLILDELPDGPVAGLLAADAVRGAAAGPRSPGTVFNLVYRYGHGGTITRPKGGMFAVIRAFAQAAQNAGCDILPGTRVSRILIVDGAVSGVETGGGMIEAPLVFTSSSPKSACQMAGVAEFDIEPARRIRNIRARGTVAQVNFKLSETPVVPHAPTDAVTRLILAPTADYVERAFNPAKYGDMSTAPVIEASLTQTADGAPCLSALVQYAPVDLKGGWTEDAQAKLADVTRSALAQHIPALNEVITATQVTTPDQIEAATGAPGGHWHHAEMSLDQVFTLRPANGINRYALGPKGLYLCGAAAHPGGDVMGLAGRNAALAALEAAS